MANRSGRSAKSGHLSTIILALVIAVAATFFGGRGLLGDSDGRQGQPVSGDGLTVHYLDVGQGDSALLQCGGETMLIDAGDVGAGETVTTYLDRQNVTAIDYLVCTHAHADHCGGMDDVVMNFPVKTIYSSVAGSGNGAFTRFAEAAKTAGVDIAVPEPDSSFQLGEATVTVLAPRSAYDDVNDMSLVLRVDYGETSFLFTGDAEYDSETDMLDAGCDVRCDVLKVGHHGSSSSTGYRLLYEAQPQYAVISCGAGNSYGHPHEETMSRLRDADVTVYRTDEDGTVVCFSDGTALQFAFYDGAALRFESEDAA